MTNDNEDALRCAEVLERPGYGWHSTPAQCAAHLRRLVAENEAKDALLRQALSAFETDDWQKKLTAANTIRQHLD